MRFLRLLLASLIAFGAMLGAAVFAFEVLPKNTPPIVIGIGAAVVLIGVALLMLFLFNRGQPKVPPGPTLEQLKAEGLMVSEDYKAKRAFEVEEFEDEGRSFFIELADGAVLFLSGQYLYDCGQDKTDSDHLHSFPNTDFTILRHRTKFYVLDIICRGSLLKPELIAPPFGPDYYDSDTAPGDGDVIRDRTYDDFKSKYGSPKRAR
jgi:hypothetical protein